MGSKEWIGAVELSYVLDELLGVTSKIISVSSGSEIESRAAELAAHFQQQVHRLQHGQLVITVTGSLPWTPLTVPKPPDTAMLLGATVGLIPITPLYQTTSWRPRHVRHGLNMTGLTTRMQEPYCSHWGLTLVRCVHRGRPS